MIRVPIMTAASAAVGSYQGFDSLNTSNQQGLASAEFNWKQYYASVVLSGYDEFRNMGEAAQVSLLKARIQQAEMSLRDTMNTDLFGDGTGNSSKALDGLAIAVDSTGTYGGFSRTGNAWWASTETAVGGVLTIARMRTLFNDISAGGREHPDLLVTDGDEYEAYEGLLQPDQRFQSNKLADGGFLNLMFKDQPIVWDASATAGVMYMLNLQYMKLYYHPQRNFKPTPFQQPTNQDARVSLILFAGNLVGNNPRMQGKLTGLTD